MGVASMAVGKTGGSNGPKSQWNETYDVVVLGSGAAGLTAALVATIEEKRTLLIEKSDRIGGTSALSSGSAWIPNNSYQRRSGVVGDDLAVMAYLDALIGDCSSRPLREAFVAAGPEMLAYFEKHIALRWLMYDVQPDYHMELAGARVGGRALMPLPFDGRELEKEFDRVRWPIPELMLFGRMMITRGEAARLLRIGRNIDSLLLGVEMIGRYALDRMRYRRGTRLVLGNALVACLFKHLLDRKGAIWYNGRTVRLLAQEGQVSGLVVQREGREIRVRVRQGLVLAGGGFPASPELCERYLPKPTAKYTTAWEGCTGDTLRLAQEVGAALGPARGDNALWFPGSIMRRRDGSTAVYPHIVLDRAKPGLIAVNAAGRRFVDEATNYHSFVRAMYQSHRHIPSIPAWLICDRRFVWKYGLGMILPLRISLKSFVEQGYLHMADSLKALARDIGVDADGLAETVKSHNAFARTGVDSDFNKGGNAYDRAYGDAEHRPNPCLGPIERPPYCAMAVYPTPLGTSLGLLTNEKAQVLERSGRPIGGLYACGNDMQNIFGGEYPGAGSQIGTGMVFGYLAALHAIKERGV